METTCFFPFVLPFLLGRFKIVVSELPYQVNKARLIENIADLVKDKRIEGLSDINDYSSKRGGGMRIVIDLKRDANPQVVLNQLYQMTQLQISYGIIQLALVNGEPKVLTLKQIIEEYIKFQCEIITRRTQYDLNKAQVREHILEGLARAIDIVDDIIATIRACKGGQQEAKTAIMEKFDFDDVQAAAIVAFRLGQLAGLEILKITNELNELREKYLAFFETKAAFGLLPHTHTGKSFGQVHPDARDAKVCLTILSSKEWKVIIATRPPLLRSATASLIAGSITSSSELTSIRIA